MHGIFAEVVGIASQNYLPMGLKAAVTGTLFQAIGWWGPLERGVQVRVQTPQTVEGASIAP